ncbi:UDP-N-acetylmuramoyl-L-alanine--D-glutamate ligase [bacterium]|nr:UDP-N-acetylmuramoyl-L-alanine--D-glutamate ligase [bacterium]
MSEKVLILGLSKSGIAAAKLANKLGYKTYITEYNSNVDKNNVKELENIGIKIEYGKHSDEFINGTDFIITSPGIPPKSDIFKRIQSRNIPIISEIEFAYLNSDTPFIAITGTNGKTTTTSLVSHILNQAFDAPACGNIGLPPSELVEDETDFLVAEISSFQAQMTEKFRPFISCWTNFTPDHIDWHEGLENYFNAKAKLFIGKQAPEYAILNAKDKKLLEFSKQCKKSKVFLFDTEDSPNASFIKNNAIWYKEDNLEEKIIDLPELPLVGHHNYQNIMCGIICAKLCGLENEIITNAIKTFKAPEHRLEKVREMNGITFYNDSKATNPEASIVAIESFNNLNVALILGGRDKNTDLKEMCQSINNHINTVLLIGEATERFEKNLRENGFNNIIIEQTLESSVDKAITLKPDVILLSPACASFDMFKSYEHRGEIFKEYVLSK